MTDKVLYRWVAGVSLVVFALVVVLNRKVLPGPATVPSFAYVLPKLNAIINGTCSVLLIVSLFCIKYKQIQAHKTLNLITGCLSTIFLLSYVSFHYIAPETLYGDLNGDGVVDAMEKGAAGGIRFVYYFILGTHIMLAAAVLPLVLLSFYRGFEMQVARHKKLVRWAFPIWLYVTITGVIVYLMISPYYHF